MLTTPIISRTTYPCGCVVDIESERDSDTLDVTDKEPVFCLMNWVCPKHEHLKSTVKGERHAEQANHVLDVIEKAKQDNIADWEATLKRARTNRDKRDVMAMRAGIDGFNRRLDEEWSELTSNTHAFDKHIHETIHRELADG